jgi:uncharacterized protein YndB with AHSA1/START domain
MDMDLERFVGGTTRTVTAGDRDGRESRCVQVTRDFATTVEDLWQAVTDPERLPRWFLPVSGDLRPGGRFQLEGHAGGEVLVCEPPEHLALTWESGEQVSWVDVRLSPTADGGVRLELSHTVPVDDHWQQFGPGAVGMGWELGIMGLVLHLSTGATVDKDEVLAWQLTPEAVDLMRRLGDAWCGAQLDGGPDAAAAEGMRDRCVAAYTGA